MFSGHKVWVRLHHRGDLLRGHGGEHPDFAPGDLVMAPTLGKPNAHQVVGRVIISRPSDCPRVHAGGDTARRTGANQGGGASDWGWDEGNNETSGHKRISRQ